MKTGNFLSIAISDSVLIIKFINLPLNTNGWIVDRKFDSRGCVISFSIFWDGENINLTDPSVLTTDFFLKDTEK